jgi:hypothetical protein
MQSTLFLNGILFYDETAFGYSIERGVYSTGTSLIQAGSSPAFNKNEGAYGFQISQTVCYLLGYPLWMDHRRPAHGIQIIFL